jgi:ribonucrease Y
MLSAIFALLLLLAGCATVWIYLQLKSVRGKLQSVQEEHLVSEATVRNLEQELRGKEETIDSLQNQIDEVKYSRLEDLKQSLDHEFSTEISKWEEKKFAEAEDRLSDRVSSLLISSMERTAMQVASSSTTATVEIPSEDVKGRIIGRDGRNIRSFEQITGVELIIDETPDTVMLSSFDPIRREIARVTLMNLIVDGRIHPAKIEEWHLKATEEIDRLLLDSAKKAASAAESGPLPKSVLETLGKLRFRTSYSQNVLDHSVEVAQIGALISDELGLNTKQFRRAALLHDIGKALGEEWEGPHAIAGMNFLKQFTETDLVLNAVGAHHREIEPSSPEAQVLIIADTLSASRPGARRISYEDYLKRMSTLESMANDHPGVERSFVVQSGREIRVIVKPELLDDANARQLAKDIAQKISAQKETSGQIKVTVIRESKFVEIVK